MLGLFQKTKAMVGSLQLIMHQHWNLQRLSFNRLRRLHNDFNNEKNLNGICLHKNLRNLQTRSTTHNSLGVGRSSSQLFWMPLGKHNQGWCIMTPTILAIILAVVIILPILLWATDRLTTNKIEFESIEEFEKFQQAFKGKNK